MKTDLIDMDDIYIFGIINILVTGIIVIIINYSFKNDSANPYHNFNFDIIFQSFMTGIILNVFVIIITILIFMIIKLIYDTYEEQKNKKILFENNIEEINENIILLKEKIEQLQKK